MTGVLVNSLAIIIGSTIGILLRKGLPKNVINVVMQGLGLSVIVIGISGAIKTNNILLLVISLVLGGLFGSLIGIDAGLNKFAKNIEKRFKSKSEDNDIAKGFIMASLVYCVGAMAIIGSIEAGVSGSNETLYIKALLDGVSAIMFTATLGIGVILSSVSVFIYQGSIVLGGFWLAPYLSNNLITEISAVGSVLIIGIAINVLEIKKINVADLLPAVLVPPIWLLISNII